jgi:hypothetical protein
MAKSERYRYFNGCLVWSFTMGLIVALMLTSVLLGQLLVTIICAGLLYSAATILRHNREQLERCDHAEQKRV